MSIWRTKEFYLKTLATFVVIVGIDWLLESGYKLFQGQSLGQVTQHYKIPFTYLGVAATIVYYNLRKEKGKS